MGQTTNYHLPYPSDYTENADVPEAIKDLAEATDEALGGITPQNMEVTTNKVTSLSNSSTDTQYPSAKCVYDLVGDIESILEELDIGGGV